MPGNQLNKGKERFGGCGQYKHRDLVQSEISRKEVYNKLNYLVVYVLQLFLIPVYTYCIFPAASQGYSLGLRKQGTTFSCFK